MHLVEVRGLSGAQLAMVREEVELIWRRHFVVFEWHEGAPPGEIDRGELSVSLGVVEAGGEHLAGGRIDFLGPVRPGAAIRLVVDAERLVREARLGDTSVSRLTRFTQHQLVARTVARTLAHEIGHYLLASRQHSRRGLMRARFTTADFMRNSLDPFRLDEAHEALLSREALDAACMPDQATVVTGVIP